MICAGVSDLGTPAHPGQLKFSDLHLALRPDLPDALQDEIAPLARRTEMRAGVSLGRQRLVAREERLYSVETHRSGEILVFQGQIKDAWTSASGGVGAAGLQQMYAVGGHKSRDGLGPLLR